MKRKLFKLISTTLLLSSLLTFTSLASWEQSEQGWKYKDDTTGVYSTKGWYWIDGNSDGIAECYYLDADGVMAVNTTVDSYTVNSEGQWVIDGVVQTKQVVGSSSANNGGGSNHSVPNTGNQANQNNSNKGKTWDGNGVDEVGGSFGIDDELAEKIQNATYY